MADRHPLVTLEEIVLIGIGGFAGSNLRYLAGSLAPGLGSTLIVNTLGSFVLGFILYEAIYTELLATHSHIVVGTGFLSSFTTYSTFALQTTQAGSVGLMASNVLATYAFGFTGVLCGRHLAQRLDGTLADEAVREAEDEANHSMDTEGDQSMMPRDDQ